MWFWCQRGSILLLILAARTWRKRLPTLHSSFRIEFFSLRPLDVSSTWRGDHPRSVSCVTWRGYLGSFLGGLGCFQHPERLSRPSPKTTPGRLQNLPKTPHDATLRFKRSDGGVAALLRCCLLLLPSVLASALASVSLFFH